MRITDVEAIIVRQPGEITLIGDGTQDTVIILVHTNEGITGAAEVDSAPYVVKSIIDMPASHTACQGLRDLVVGEDPFDVEKIWNKMYEFSYYHGRAASKHLESISAKLEEMGLDIVYDDESVTVTYIGPMNRINVKTMPYPGFPTDMQPQMGVLLCLANGVSCLSEGVYDNRFRYVEELKRMGASVKVDGRTAVIEGVQKLSPAQIKAVDLRAGAAMVIAGLATAGQTEIEDIHHIERGYDDIVGKLKSVGADIKKVVRPDSTAFAKAN